MTADCAWCHLYKCERDEARAELAQSRTGEERLEMARLKKEIRRMQVAAEVRNRQLDALHVVWCDGGCESGMHRFDGTGPAAVTQEIVDTAVRNTERLKRWWANYCSRQRRRAEEECIAQ